MSRQNRSTRSNTLIIRLALVLAALLACLAPAGEARADFNVQYALYGVDAGDKGGFLAFVKSTDANDQGKDWANASQRINVSWPFMWGEYAGQLWTVASFMSADSQFKYALSGVYGDPSDGGQEIRANQWGFNGFGWWGCYIFGTDISGNPLYFYDALTSPSTQDFNYNDYLVSNDVGSCNNTNILFLDNKSYKAYAFYQKQGKVTQTYSFSTAIPVPSWDDPVTDNFWTNLGASVTKVSPVRKVTTPVKKGWACTGYELMQNGVKTTGGGTTATFTLQGNDVLSWFYEPGYDITVALKERSLVGTETDLLPAVRTLADPQPWYETNFMVGGNATVSVNDPLATGTGERYKLIGWRGTGNLNSMGTSNSVDFSLTRDSSITWLYEKQNRLRVGFKDKVPAIPTAVRVAANPQPPAGDSWFAVGSNQSPYITRLVSDNEGNRWSCDSWTRTGAEPQTNNPGSSAPFTLTLPSEVTWDCREVNRIDVQVSGLPAALSGLGFAPAVTTDWATHDQPVTFKAPLVIYDFSRDYRYDLDPDNPVSIRSNGVEVTPVMALDGALRTATVPPLAGDLTVIWNYRELIRLKVEAGGLTALTAADPVECSGDSSAAAVQSCINNANSGISGTTSRDSGENYYPANTGIVATARSLVADGSDKTCTVGYVYGPAASQGDLFSGRRYLSFQLDRPTRIVWDYADATPIAVGQALAPPADWNGLEPDVQLVSPALEATPPDGKYFFGGLPKRLHFLRPFATVRVTWARASGENHPSVHYVVGWPASPRIHVAGAPVRLMTPTRTATFSGIAYTDGSLAAVDNGVFNVLLPGFTVLKFVAGLENVDTLNPVSFLVVRTVAWESVRAAASATVGTRLTDAGHDDPEGRDGYVIFPKAPYLASSPEGYNRAERTGPIIPVNETFSTQPDRRMAVAWYREAGGIGWPESAVEYAVAWPGTPTELPIGSGRALTASQAAGRVYHQPDPALAGFNPNEEHALLDGETLHALRDDLNRYGTNDLEWHSRPFALLVYTSAGQTRVDVFKVTRPATFDGTAAAGRRLSSPLPAALPPHAISRATAGLALYHRDRTGGHWAKGVLPGQDIVMAWYYPLRDDFFFPDYDGDLRPDLAAGDPVPFLGSAGWSLSPAAVRPRNDAPLAVRYAVSWPDDADIPRLSIGDTLTDARDNLPGVRYWPSGQVIFDSGLAAGSGPLVKLYAPFRALGADLASLPDGVSTEPQDALTSFPDLPPTLRRRLFHDPLAKRLIFTGAGIADGGSPWVLSNLMTAAERDLIKTLSTAASWTGAVDALYAQTRNPQGLIPGIMGRGGNVRNPLTGLDTGAAAFWDAWGILLGLDFVIESDGTAQPVLASLVGEQMALSAGMARGTGHVTLIAGDDPSLDGEPIALHVIKVVSNPVYRGEVRVLAPENVFDERLTLRRLGDFGGEPELFDFEWYYQPDPGSPPALPGAGPAPAGWTFHAAGPGMVETTIGGGSVKTLSNNYFISRYYYRNAWPAIAAAPSPALSTAYSTPQDLNNWSRWAGADDAVAQLATGWTRRVFDALNPLEARVRDFRRSATSTVVSMISQLGERYEGDIALGTDPEFINGVGLIQAYETILHRALELSVDAGIDDPAANSAALNAASRIAGFYMLLGNEAYADALDPTVGLGTGSAEYGSLASSVFAFQNQLPTLLDEELCLLRGRDDTFTSTRARPYYNRLIWNFTQGDGEVAYAQVYNIGDTDGSGVIDAADARRLYPQGHGDAWGHYLTAMTTWLKLLRHPNFAWQPRTESVLVGGTPVLVDYQDERAFAAAAAARARAGAEVVDLTYRQAYVDDPSGQWQGYKDTDADRSWGMDEWARRAGQGALFEWAVANALLPDTDPDHTGISKVDRTTVPELGDLAAQYDRIQSLVSKADRGVNPLGLAKGAVVFDIDPAMVDQGKTHFEQVYDRALKALRNAADVFDYASSFTRGLRQNDESLEDFRRTIEERENDYLNRLIEIFGYPYPEDIGTTYPAGYEGPDWIHFMYVDHSVLTGEPPPPVEKYLVDFTYDLEKLDESLGIVRTLMQVEYALAATDAYLLKPPEWTGQRRAPGEAQRALSEVVLADAALTRAIKEYEYKLGEIETAKGDLESKYGILGYQLQVTNELNGQQDDLDKKIGDAQYWIGWNRVAQNMLGGMRDSVVDAMGSEKAAVPIFVASTAFTVAGTALDFNATRMENEVAGYERTQAQNERNAGYKISVADASFEVANMAYAVEVGYNDLILKQLEIDTRTEALKQAEGQYRAVVAEGQRLMNERARFRAQTAADVQEYRYDDLSFRVFRNDALQKYRAQFDLAARYVYLAAAAYDYETNLLGSASGSGGGFMADIVRQRSLGQLLDGNPVAGRPGLADPLARMAQNFEVYKTQLGFNNPQTETNRFSLRNELRRQAGAGEESWRQALGGIADGTGKSYYRADLWQVPEFKRFCRPFAPESAGAQPGLVIPFSTKIAFGENFFGLPLAAGDSAYDPSNFATKVRKVGVWFEGYDTGKLSLTPRVYLVPVGADVLRSPTGDGFALRKWNVVDQKLPVPFALGASDMTDQGLIPVNDSLSDILGDIRRFSSFRAYPDPGDSAALWQTQMTADSRLIGRSVWNTRWLLIIPGGTFLANSAEGLKEFINTVDDIKLFFQTYAYSGN